MRFSADRNPAAGQFNLIFPFVNLIEVAKEGGWEGAGGGGGSEASEVGRADAERARKRKILEIPDCISGGHSCHLNPRRPMVSPKRIIVPRSAANAI